jgi:DNA adenine methylase
LAANANNERLTSVFPLLRWAGSKRKSLSRLASFWKPTYGRYVEPFAGSAALFFEVEPSRAVLGDINGGLIETYEVIRERPDEVHRAVAGLPRTEADYYRIRSQNPLRLSRLGRAVRFVYLNRLCFNGIYRTNTKGEFNVPYAHTRSGRIPGIEDFRRCALMLQRATLKCAEFGKILSQTGKDDFVYLDPPYALQERRVFRQYDKREFTVKDLERLAAHLVTIDRKGAAFILSYEDCAEARALFRPWHIETIMVRRNVAGFVGARRLATEVLVTNICQH